MKEILKQLLSWVAKTAIFLRYRLEISGLETIEVNPERGILFLPNHSAEMDPLILFNALKKRFKVIRPLVVDTFYFQPGIRFCMDLVRAVPVPNFDQTANGWKIKRMQKVFQMVEEGLKAGDNFLIFPSGRLKGQGREVIGGASFIPKFLELYPDTNIVLVRIGGLWGSMFSKALTGKTPDFGQMLLKGVKIILKNGLFFIPKRKVSVEFERAPDDFPRKGNRTEINQYLEQWYNRPYDAEGEPLTLISHSRWKKDLPSVAMPGKKEGVERIPVPEEVRAAILPFLSRLASIEQSKIRPDMELAKDLGVDSLEIAEIHLFLSESFDLPSLPPGTFSTVEDLLQFAAGAHFEKKEEMKGAKTGWPLEKKKRPAPFLPEGKTIAEVFLKNCKRMDGYAACTDRLAGVFTYRRFKRSVLVLSSLLKRLPEERIGLLFPASTAVYLLIFACILAKKVPVMLNWTTGPRALDAAIEISGIRTVISSRKFLDRLNVPDLGKLEEMLLFLEEMKSLISIRDRLGAFLPRSGRTDLGDDEEKPAVLLFTSGTESYPKAVPLTHRNLLENQRAVLKCIRYTGDDIFASILPPFHSFGFTVTGLLPLLAGFRVFYAPDPTDSYGLVRDCRDFRPTIFCAAPSFYRGLFKAGNAHDFEPVRLFASGAEKTPPELFETVRQYGKELLEGYGITECSPIVTLNREGTPARGVGYPLPGVELAVIHPETLERLTAGQTGEICVFGPNVFNGYLGGSPNPFIEMDGKKWYRTGDLGFVDEKGALILSGRLKRFVKIGGEMISLAAIEEELEKAALKKKWITAVPEAPILSVAVKREENRPLLILFTTFKIETGTINEALREAGFSPIIKISEIRFLEQIPLTGTGKTNYRFLDAQC